MILNYLPVDREQIFNRPEKFIIDIEQTLYQINVSYNNHDKSFYFSMYLDENKKPLIEGRKIVYGQNLLENIIDDDLPEDVNIIVVNTAEDLEEDEVTKDNFMKEVKPYILVGDGNG